MHFPTPPGKFTKDVQRCERGASAGIPEFYEIVLAP